ncbi:hypothetical protein Fmac_024419 [Flemingia macrophylla]|uniref:Leucine-rich repeat-containing N-terminal plant-type domain-containing protein n=1 Tax=Flemingia macrophylla TaxID=520843 RepID=A0ABD1LPC9_9FABA
MGFSTLSVLFTLVFLLSKPTWVCGNEELRTLIDMKSSLDPESRYLPSWTVHGDPCDGSFEGVACNEKGQVANISLQGKGLSGKLSPAIANLNHLTGLYLHYNSLNGEIPKEIANLTQLVDLYLNVNNLSGEIPREIPSMKNLQVLQLCYNQLKGSIPTQLGALRNLRVVALQSNHFTGAIPASLGDLGMLLRLDLSSNKLFGSIPLSLADAPSLKVLDVHNNTLSRNVPPALKSLDDGFLYKSNMGLCGVGFPTLKACNASDHVNPGRPEPYGAATRDIPETANVKLPCNGTGCLKSSKFNESTTSITVGIFVVVVALSVIGILTFTLYRRRKEKVGGSFHITDSHQNTDEAPSAYRKNGSPLVNLEYSIGWDPLAD